MLGRTKSAIDVTSRNSSGYRKRSILNTVVRAVATAATTSTTGVSGGAFLLAHSHSPCTTVRALDTANQSVFASRIGRSNFGTTRRSTIANSRTRETTRMFSSLSDSSEQKTDSSSDTSDKPLEAMCLVTLQACEAMTPAVEALYKSIGAENTKEKTITKAKADDSVFTIADGLVQFLLTEVLLGKTVGDIVGEEDCVVNLDKKPYVVDDFVVPAEFEDAIDQAIKGVTAARDGLAPKSLYQSLTAFIDPIDGTREFSTQKGEQCTICIGFADTESGRPVAGVVYRPLSHPHPTWAAGAKEESYVASSLLPVEDRADTAGSLLTTNGRISPFLDSLMTELNYERVPSGGAGNKMLMLLEGQGTAYIQDRGVSRWDTCGAQAVLEAHGGILCKLDSFLQGGDESSSISYTYRKTEQNLDFEPGKARLTKYNAAEGVDIQTDNMAMAPSDVKPYANLCGLVALGKLNNNEKSRAAILDGLVRATEVSPPAFD